MTQTSSSISANGLATHGTSATETCVPLSPLERIKQLDEERARLSEEAKEAALVQAREAVELLNALGLPYELHMPSAQSRKSSRARKSADQPHDDGPCPVCAFKTVPPHDGRKHRMQGDAKRAFSDAELADLKMTRV